VLAGTADDNHVWIQKEDDLTQQTSTTTFAAGERAA